MNCSDTPPFVSKLTRAAQTLELNTKEMTVKPGLPMGYNAVDIGRTTVQLSLDNGLCLTNLKLQKLLYFAWIEYFKKTGKPLFDDDFEAWKYGPVVPSVYYDFWQYAGSTIVFARTPSSPVDAMTKEFLLSMLEKYKDCNAYELIDASHDTAAWRDSYVQGCKRRIPRLSMEAEACLSAN